MSPWTLPLRWVTIIIQWRNPRRTLKLRRSGRNVTHIPICGGSGITPTGAMQFQDDWPGLFIRGDQAVTLAFAVERLQARVAGHPDLEVANALRVLQEYADIINRDVVVSRADIDS